MAISSELRAPEERLEIGSDLWPAWAELADLPSQWDATQLRWLVQADRPITYGIVQCGPDQEQGIHYIRPVDMLEEGGLAVDRLQKTSPEIAQQYQRSRLTEGDLVVSIGPSFGKVMVVPSSLEGANLTQGTARVSPSDLIDKRFLFWVLRSRVIHAFWDAECSGATFRALTLAILRKTPVPLPPRDIQQAIAEFLNQQTAIIDDLIAKKERLIELLEEKRTALITQAVTKGLDPDVPMKSSGVEWLGAIPEHWETPELRYLCDTGHPIMYGIILPGPSVEDGVPIIKSGDVKGRTITAKNLSRTTDEIDQDHAKSRVKPGDAVYSIRGSFGDVARIPPELAGANITQDVARISPREQVDSMWLEYALRSSTVAAQIDAAALGAAVRGINIRELKRVRVPLPPYREQETIAKELDRRENTIQRTINTVHAALDRLTEYRSALITAAVTGKIDVRNQAA